MEDKENNMEEFIRNAVESFDDAPSDKVWENVSSRLDIPIPFYQKFGFWIISGLSVGIILLGIQNFLLQDRVSLLETSLAKYSLATPADSIPASPQPEGRREATTASDPTHSNISTPQIQKSEPTPASPKISPNYSSSSQLKYPFSQSINSPSIFSKNLIFNSSEKRDLVVSNINESKDSITNSQKGLAEKKYLLFLGHTARQGYLTNPATHSEFISIPKDPFAENPTELLFPTKGSLGISGAIFIPSLDLKTNLKPGYSFGVEGEYPLFGRLSLKSALRFNTFTYQVDKQNFEPEKMDRYNRYEFFNIESLSVQSHYFDIPVGLTWNEPLNETFGLYLGTGVSWKIYLPQKFDYLIVDGNIESYTETYVDKRYFGYFGTWNVEAGFEKRISPKVLLRMGLWGEKSLHPLGVEGRKVNIIGVRSSFIFKK